MGQAVKGGNITIAWHHGAKAQVVRSLYIDHVYICIYIYIYIYMCIYTYRERGRYREVG
jgi:hypothetical protein